MLSPITYQLGAVLVKGAGQSFQSTRGGYWTKAVLRNMSPTTITPNQNDMKDTAAVAFRGSGFYAAKRWCRSDCEVLHGEVSVSGSDAERNFGHAKSWSARRRDSKVNAAKLCWRRVQWYIWSGVKRIFHWNPVEGRFDVMKVNGAENELYETQADTRLFAGSLY
ncbi:hypothetical protein F5I97DRAFT_401139 [Phlebopus sp. FC_14]|nr:hypothetical protein F5I97DRAFT_401139 [Phlebopus sp. FC_14]